MQARARICRYTLQALKLGRAAHLHVTKSSRLLANNGLAVLYCERASTLSVDAGLCVLWCPLRGEIGIAEAGARFGVPKNLLHVADTQRAYEAEVSPAGACIAIIGSQLTWSAINAFGGDEHAATPSMFPALHAADAATRRAVIAFARECFAADAAPSAWRVAMLAAIVGRLQQPFEALIRRCPGRTLARRRSVFLRLQRARLYIELYNSMELDVSMLAQIASYSLWQFIKIFRQVYGETPHNCLARCRIAFATMLLRSRSLMGISDVARAAGFASRSSFARNMRQYSGCSATRLRDPGSRR